MSGLSKQQDAFGMAYQDWYAGHDVGLIVERDDGFIDVDRLGSIYLSDFKKWPVHERKGVQLARRRVVDVGCGPGRVGLYLQDKGCDAIGIDVSPGAIKVSKKRGLKKAHMMSITELSGKLGTIDTIVMYGNNFGLFGNPQRARWLLRRWKRITSDQARIIAEALDPFRTSDRNHLDYHRLNHSRGRLGGQLRLRLRYQKCMTPWFDYLFVSRKEMQEIVEGTGWRISQFIDSDGSLGPQYIAVIEKE